MLDFRITLEARNPARRCWRRYPYLRDVLDRIGTHPAWRIEEMLPDRWQAFRQVSAAAQD